jgi:hypothetical protein
LNATSRESITEILLCGMDGDLEEQAERKEAGGRNQNCLPLLKEV